MAKRHRGHPLVMVHGIWMTGLDMRWLGRKLAQAGFDIYSCHYPSLRSTPQQNALVLHEYISKYRFDRVHLVGHSLGGIVLHHLFAGFPKQPPGRVVLLGSPVQGSGVAKRLAANRLFRMLLGRSVEQGLLGDVPAWVAERELGVIAGTRGIGVGRLVGGLEGESDGTVALSETRVDAAKASCQVEAGHMGLLFSSRVAKQTAHFLDKGFFLAD